MNVILIIESSRVISRTLSGLLRAKGYTVLTENYGEQGIKRINAVFPSLIICNTTLSDMSGFDILSTLNQNQETRGIPFLFLSSDSSVESIKRAMSIGADSYIIRPYIAKELVNIIENKFAKIDFIRKREYITNMSDPENNSVMLDINKNKKIIKKNNIEYIISEGSSSKLFILNSGQYKTNKQLKSWEELLPENFHKIHRSIIINLNHVKDIDNWGSRSPKIIMKYSNQSFSVSYRNAVKLKSILKEKFI